MSPDEFTTERPVRLQSRAGLAEKVHVFDDASILAVRSALAAKRPLLVRGEPGVGKTQLAAATARVLKRPLISFVVNARTEASDLLFRFDSVRRLAEAQLCAALKLDVDQVKELLAVPNFVSPGPLWWGFNWQSALDQATVSQEPPHETQGADPKNGCVVLIDEIDKADTDVPNGLLEALGSTEFTPSGCGRVEALEPTPLVIVTTNEERVLPDAFVRRCLVLRLKLPERQEALVAYLKKCGKAHFQKIDDGDQEFREPPISDELLEQAANLLAMDREHAVQPLPGLAEYLDLLRAARDLSRAGHGDPAELLKKVRRFTSQKHQESDQ